jgi:uncharacterized protein YdiU (UPF0061 family)
MEAYDPATVFSSIDHGGRYAYGNQPGITAWNLARLAETLLPLIDDDPEAAVAAATAVLERFPHRFHAAHDALLRAKLGLGPGQDDGDQPSDDADRQGATLADDLLGLMQEHRVDHTLGFRSLSAAARGDAEPARARFADAEAFDRWLARWTAELSDDREAVAAAMDAVNPLYVARNHLVEEALDAAYEGDLGPTEQLLEVLAHPFEERPGLERYAEPAPPDFGPYRTFCGT